MHDPETESALERIRNRNLWTVGWFLSVVVSLLILSRVYLDWHARDLTGKLEATGLTVFLVFLPIKLVLLRKRRKPISAGWLVMLMYALAMLAAQTFGSR